MLHDGITLTNTSEIKDLKIEEVITLPITNLRNGRLVVLTATDGTHTPGTYIYLGTVWLNLLSVAQLGTLLLPYDIAFYLSAAPTDINTSLLGFLSTREVTLAAANANIAKCATTPSATTVFGLNVNAVPIATVTYSVGNHVGVISFTGNQTIQLHAGDEVTLSSGETVDSSIKGIGITLIGHSTLSS